MEDIYTGKKKRGRYMIHGSQSKQSDGDLKLPKPPFSI